MSCKTRAHKPTQKIINRFTKLNISTILPHFYFVCMQVIINIQILAYTNIKILIKYTWKATNKLLHYNIMYNIKKTYLYLDMLRITFNSFIKVFVF